MNDVIKAFSARINSLWAEYQELIRPKTPEEKEAKDNAKKAKDNAKKKEKEKKRIEQNKKEIEKEAEIVRQRVAAERAAAEFKPHPKAIAALMSKITAYNEGQNVTFSPEEIKAIEEATAAAEKFLIVIEPLPDIIKAALQNMLNNAKTIAKATLKIHTEQQKQREDAQQTSSDNIKTEQARRLNAAKDELKKTKASLEEQKLKYDEDLRNYNEAKNQYDKLSAEEKAKKPAPIPPKNPDETLLDGITLTTILSELENRIANSHSSRVNSIGGTWFCGISAVSDLVINNNPEGYVQAVMDLVRTGKGKFFPDGKEIKLPKHLKNATTKELLYWSNSEHTVDLVFGGSIREKHNGLLGIKKMFRKNSMPRFNQGFEIKYEQMFGMDKSSFYEGTLPSQTEKMLRTCGLQIDKKKIKRSSTIKDLKIIEAAVSSGLTPIVLDNDLIRKGTPAIKVKDFIRKKGKHYLPIYQFKFFIDTDGVEKITIQFWEYGALKTAVTRTVEQVIGGMKGYWIPEAPQAPQK